MFEALADTIGGMAFLMTRALVHGVYAGREDWNIAIELVRYDDVDRLRFDDRVATYGAENETIHVSKDVLAESTTLPRDAVEQEAAKRTAHERRVAARTVSTVPREDVVDALDALEENLLAEAETAEGRARPEGDLADVRIERGEVDAALGTANAYREAARVVGDARRRFEDGGRDA